MAMEPLRTTITVPGLSETVCTEPLKTADATQREHTKRVKATIQRLARAAVPDDYWESVDEQQRARIFPFACGKFVTTVDPYAWRKPSPWNRNFHGQLLPREDISRHCAE